MTCREFKDAADSRALLELATVQDGPIVKHARECSKCAEWLREQHMLCGALRALTLRTANREAGPEVEQALLRSFRQSVSAREVEPLRFALTVPERIPWLQWSAYAAVAVALAFVLFVGYRSVNHRIRIAGRDHPVPVVIPRVRNSTTAKNDTAEKSVSAGVLAPLETASRAISQHPAKASDARPEPALSGPASASTEETLAKAGYVDLMLCDPLSCASDAQVVRMELPPQGADGQGNQPVIADVVVGDDGVVRAVRIVN